MTTCKDLLSCINDELTKTGELNYSSYETGLSHLYMELVTYIVVKDAICDMIIFLWPPCESYD